MDMYHSRIEKSRLSVSLKVLQIASYAVAVMLLL